MFFIKNILLILIVFYNIIFIAQSAFSEGTSYPETLEERKRENRGSILGEEGIQLNINKVDHTPLERSKKQVVHINDNNFIWLAALERVKSTPLNSADFKGGVIVTDWFNLDKKTTQRYKLSIFIKSQKISLESFDVNVYSESFKKGRWVEDNSQSEFMKRKIINDILLLAKDLKAKTKGNN